MNLGVNLYLNVCAAFLLNLFVYLFQMDLASFVAVKQEYSEDTDCQIVTAEEPGLNIKEENEEEAEEELYLSTDGCCEVKMEEYDWDDQVGDLGHTAINGPYQGVNIPYVPGQIPFSEDGIINDPTSPGSREKPYFCNFCDYRTHKTSALAQHVRTHTGEKPFSCHLCDFTSSTSGSLKRHVRRHTGEKPYPCNECEYRGTSASDLQVHMRSHDSGKSFNCGMCEYRGTTSWNLKTHLKTHTGDKPYSCHLCDFKCSASGSLKRHVKRHTGEKPYQCDACKYRCSCSSDLKVHRLIHLPTEDKPFACKLCDWRGVTNGQLKIHMKSHGKPKFYECSVCGLKTGRINNLRNHMKTHSRQTEENREGLVKGVSTGEKPYACESADCEATSSGELSNHETPQTIVQPLVSCNDSANEVVTVNSYHSSGDTSYKEELKNDLPKVELTDPS